MKSKLIQKDHEHLSALIKRMTPEERLLACYEHSKLMHELFEAGQKFRSQKAALSKKKYSRQ